MHEGIFVLIAADARLIVASRRVLLIAAMMAAFAADSAQAQFRELLARAPRSANAVVILNVDQALKSPMAARENWKSKLEKAFDAGLMRVPPLATNYVLTSELDLEFMEPKWSAAIIDLAKPMSLSSLGDLRGGVVDSFDDIGAVALPNDIYLVRFTGTTIGAMQPGNRQTVQRWARDARSGKTDGLSLYLMAAAGYSDDANTDIIMAIDLDGAFSWERAAKFLARHKSTLKLSDDQMKHAAEILAGAQGVRVGIRLSDRAFAKITVDFRTDPAALADVARPLLMDALADAGMRIDDLENWKTEVGPKTVSLSGNLTTSGLRRAMSVIDAPEIPSNSKEQSAQSEADKLLMAKAKPSLDHFHAVVSMADDLKKDMSELNNLASASTYFAKYAKRIERLPILNVDPELLAYSSFVAKSLRASELAVRNMGINAGVRQAEIISSGAGVGYASYGRYGMYGGYYAEGTTFDPVAEAKGIAAERRVVRAEEKADAAGYVHQIRASLIDATADIRRKMTQKYQVEF